MSIVHIVGLTIQHKGRVVQRCALCGAMLCDSEGCSMPLNEDGTVPEFPTWETGRLVEVEAGNPTSYTLLPETDRLPENNCFEFV